MNQQPKPNSPESFYSKVRISAGCWQWLAGGDGRYGHKWNGKRTVAAHRFSYERFFGPIPDGLTLDHLCRVTSCVNPSHLEPVDEKTNILRGFGLAGVNSRKTHCKNGHAFDTANTWTDGTRRCCRACTFNREQVRKARAALAASESSERKVKP
jgi:HNH endonuclease